MTWRWSKKHSQEAFPGAVGGRRAANVAELNGDADATQRLVRSTLVRRSRAITNSSAYGGRALQLMVDHIVGARGMLGVPRANDTERQGRLQRRWKNWTQDPRECDYNGRLTFGAMQALVTRCLIESGEVLIRRYYSEDNRTVPLQLQILEPDFLDDSRDRRRPETLEQGTTDHLGIRYRQGRAIGYWLYDQHPGSNLGTVAHSTLHSAEDILHCFRQDRAGQGRGVPWLASLLVRLTDFDDCLESEQLRQKLASAYVAFVTDLTGVSSGSNEYSETIEPGSIEVLPGGKDVKLSAPPQAPNFESFTTVMLRQIAAGYGVTYEGLTGDYSRVNYSSARIAQNEFQLTVDGWRHRTVISQFLDPVWRWFRESMEDSGPVEMEWTPPHRALLDPEKEAKGLLIMVRSGFMTWQEAVKRMGRDPVKVIEEIAETNEALDRVGVLLDSDPRQSLTVGEPENPGDEKPQEQGNA